MGCEGFLVGDSLWGIPGDKLLSMVRGGGELTKINHSEAWREMG